MKMKYRYLPNEVEAIRLAPNNLDDVRDFLGGEEYRNIDFSINYKDSTVRISMRHGMGFAEPGDWIVKNVDGQFTAYKTDLFEKMFQDVDVQARNG